MKQLLSLSQSKIAFLRQLFATCAASGTLMSYGIISGYTAQAIPSMNNGSSPLSLSSAEIMWISGIIPFISMIVCPLSSPFYILIGRKRVIVASCILMILGWLVISYAVNGTMLIIGRALTGAAGGCAIPATLVYVSEISSSGNRGFLGSIINIAWRLGIICSYVIGSFVEWNWLALSSILVPLLQFLALYKCQLSPRWLISRNRLEEARKSLLYYRGDTLTDEIEEEFKNCSVSESKNINPLPSMWRYRKIVLICLVIYSFIVFSGFSVIDYHGKKILIEAHVMSNLDPNIGLVLIGVGALFGNILSSLLIDRMGRKILLLISSVFLIISQIGLGVYFYIKQHSDLELDNLRILPFVFLVLFVIFFSIGWGSVSFIVATELVPTSIRSETGLLCNVWEQILIFLQLYMHDTIYETIGPEYLHLLCGGFCLFGALFVIFVLPETAGKSLEEIEKNFESEKKEKETCTDFDIVTKL